jgi:hypothetical protein
MFVRKSDSVTEFKIDLTLQLKKILIGNFNA